MSLAHRMKRASGGTAFSAIFANFSLDRVDRNIYTFSDIPFGGSRHILVFVYGDDGTGTFSNPAVSIGGVSATLIEDDRNNELNMGMIAYIAEVPSTALGSVVVTYNETVAACGVFVYRLDNLESVIAYDKAESVGATTFPHSPNVDVQDGGYIITAMVGVGSTLMTDVNYSAGVTADFSEINTELYTSSHVLFACGSQKYESAVNAQLVTMQGVGADPDGDFYAMIVVSFL